MIEHAITLKRKYTRELHEDVMETYKAEFVYKPVIEIGKQDWVVLPDLNDVKFLESKWEIQGYYCIFFVDDWVTGRDDEGLILIPAHFMYFRNGIPVRKLRIKVTDWHELLLVKENARKQEMMAVIKK